MYALPAWQQLVLETKHPGFGSSLAFDGHYLEVGQADVELRTDPVSGAWLYDADALRRATTVNSTFGCMVVRVRPPWFAFAPLSPVSSTQIHYLHRSTGYFMLSVMYIAMVAGMVCARESQVFDTSAWAEQLLCPSGIAQAAVLSGRVAAIGPQSSLGSPDVAPLWVSGWRVALVNGIAITLAVSLRTIAPNPQRRTLLEVHEYPLRT